MRIAWLVPGGMSAEDPFDHNPVLVDLAHRIGSSVELAIFSFSPTRTASAYSCGRASVHAVPSRVNDHPMRRAKALIPVFHKHHRISPFDAIHGFWALPSGVHAASLGRWYGIPSLVTFPGGDTASIPMIGYGNLSRATSRLLTRYVCRAATQIHLLTEFQRLQLSSSGFRLRKATVLPIGVDHDRFTGLPNAPKPPYSFLHVSNLTEVKDQATLFRAVRSFLTEGIAVLRIIGPDHMNGSLQRLASELGIAGKVDFTGRLPREELPGHYRRADLYIHTSLHEGQSVSVVEAMASGTPVCGTRVGILADLPSGCVLTVNPGDHSGLSGAIGRLINDPHLYATQARNAQEWARTHSVVATCETLVRLYHDITHGSPS